MPKHKRNAKVRNFQLNEYESGLVPFYSAHFICCVLQDEGRSQEFLVYTADTLKLDKKSLLFKIKQLLKENNETGEPKDKEVIKLLNPSIFDFFNKIKTRNIKQWQKLYTKLSKNWALKCFKCLKEGHKFVVGHVNVFFGKGVQEWN